jgi:hypothetical protein
MQIDKFRLQIGDDVALFPLPWPLNSVSVEIEVIGGNNGPICCTVGGTSRYFRKGYVTLEDDVKGAKFDTEDEIDLAEFEKLKRASENWIKQQLRVI